MASLERLRQIVSELRQKCPWDRAQTFESLAPLTWEEVSELLDAIERRSPEAIQEELGDVLLHVIFYAQLAQENGWTDIEAVIHHLIQKLIARHPHVYGEAQAADAKAVIARWEALKQAERGTSPLAGVPERLSPILQAYRLQEKAAALGFDWASPQALYPKLQEELAELQKALQENDYTTAEKELGDVLFVLVNLARHLQINPERALALTNQKFRQRFEWMEAQAQKDQKDLRTCSPEELESYWQASKAYYP
ncbi:MAG: nucleoside triphosphate pyrophosphohydrolase [Bacteroidia bacterium]|nr:nucleoside triphosphate pyrophosphohydrolase [Bacteroidia bacterium]MCX7763616.1 nucleoside triphosphate pyrophosphohydrolase [Bacteroidia bacterium]MDW8057729.1 nucleoside triphosphate pyrophosphohydrolase [Bacteroidia bacterium]